MLIFASTRRGTEPSKLDTDDLDAPLVGAFLEHQRENGVRTRNARLAASVHCFATPRFAIPSMPL
jgi:integrase/recombinase XerD